MYIDSFGDVGMSIHGLSEYRYLFTYILTNKHILPTDIDIDINIHGKNTNRYTDLYRYTTIL